MPIQQFVSLELLSLWLTMKIIINTVAFFFFSSLLDSLSPTAVCKTEQNKKKETTLFSKLSLVGLYLLVP